MSTISFSTALDSDSDWIFELKKTVQRASPFTEGKVWDEQHQKHLHEQEWQQVKPTLVTCNDQRAGSYHLVPTAYGYYLSRLCILPEFQQQGYAETVLAEILKKMDDEMAECRLYILQGDPVAVLFKKFGFMPYASEAHYVYMRRKPSRYYPRQNGTSVIQ